MLSCAAVWRAAFRRALPLPGRADRPHRRWSLAMRFPEDESSDIASPLPCRERESAARRDAFSNASRRTRRQPFRFCEEFGTARRTRRARLGAWSSAASGGQLRTTLRAARLAVFFRAFLLLACCLSSLIG